MASYTYEQLKGMTVAQLRQIADELKNDALEGHSIMHKEQLLPALCKVLGIATHHVAAGQEKARIKAAIRKLKAQRGEATTARDYGKLATVRMHIHALKRRLRRMAAGAS